MSRTRVCRRSSKLLRFPSIGYPTRAETAILRARQPELRRFAGPEPILIEYGAGAGVKTELVLGALAAPQGYVPIDVAHEIPDSEGAPDGTPLSLSVGAACRTRLPERIRDAHGHARRPARRILP